MAYQAVSHARSHRVPFHGLGRAPGYMGNYCADGMAGPSPGDADYGSKSASSGGSDILKGAFSAFTGAGASGGGAAGTAAGGGAAAWGQAVAEGFKATSTIIDAAQGGYQKRERESRRNLQIATLQAQAAAGNAAAQIEIARLQAEAAVEAARIAGRTGDASSKKMMMAIGGAAIIAVVGIGAVVLLKK